MRNVLAMVLLGTACTASAQTMYRCQDGDRTVYSDKPCWSGVEVKRMLPSGGQTPEDRARAQMRLQAERDKEISAQRAAKDTRSGQVPAKDVVKTAAGTPTATVATGTAAAAPKPAK